MLRRVIVSDEACVGIVCVERRLSDSEIADELAANVVADVAAAAGRSRCAVRIGRKTHHGAAVGRRWRWGSKCIFDPEGTVAFFGVSLERQTERRIAGISGWILRRIEGRNPHLEILVKRKDLAVGARGSERNKHRFTCLGGRPRWHVVRDVCSRSCERLIADHCVGLRKLYGWTRSICSDDIKSCF